MAKSRQDRVAELIRQEIAGLLMKGIKDPRIGFVSVMGTRVSPDLRYANIYVSILGDEKERKGTLVGLQNASGWVRRELGQRLRLRFTPEVRFFEDTSLDNVYRLEEKIREIHAEEEHVPDEGE